MSDHLICECHKGENDEPTFSGPDERVIPQRLCNRRCRVVAGPRRSFRRNCRHEQRGKSRTALGPLQNRYCRCLITLFANAGRTSTQSSRATWVSCSTPWLDTSRSAKSREGK